VGVKHGKDDGTNKNDNKAGKSEIFYQTKGFGPFCKAGRFHNVSIAAMKGRSISYLQQTNHLGLINKSECIVGYRTDCHYINHHIPDTPYLKYFVGGNQQAIKVFVMSAELNA
jgi:hypothetical protein